MKAVVQLMLISKCTAALYTSLYDLLTDRADLLNSQINVSYLSHRLRIYLKSRIMMSSTPLPTCELYKPLYAASYARRL